MYCAFLRAACIGVMQTGVHYAQRRGRMKKPRSALLFFVLLVLGLSLAVPAEDVSETAYDESEGTPYESTPLFSTLTCRAAASAGAVECTVRPHSGTVFRFAVTRITGTNRHRPPETRLALLCTLLC
jgi:hypothetical protein